MKIKEMIEYLKAKLKNRHHKNLQKLRQRID